MSADLLTDPRVGARRVLPLQQRRHPDARLDARERLRRLVLLDHAPGTGQKIRADGGQPGTPGGALQQLDFEEFRLIFENVLEERGRRRKAVTIPRIAAFLRGWRSLCRHHF